MFSTKFLFSLVSLGMAAAVATVLLARNSHNMAREDDVHRVLIKDRDQAWALLKSEARVRLDELLRVAGDQDVMRLLQKASASERRLNSDDRARLTTALQRQNKNLESYAGDMLVALDSRGQSAAQLWESGPSKSGYSLAGFPAVQSALRGYMQDDIWALSTDASNPSQVKIVRVATRPVISSGRYVGAVVHGQYLDSAFAQRLANRLGAQVVFFRGPVVLATGLPQIDGFEPHSDQVIATPVPELFNDEQFRARGRSGIIELPGDLIAVYTLVMGEASLVEGSNVGYAIVRKVPAMTSSTEFISTATTEDWKELLGSGPGIALVVCTILILVGGFLGFYFESGRPITVLRREVTRLANREVDRLNVYAVSRKYRKTAESINQALDKALTEAGGNTGAQSAAIDDILGAPEEEGRLSSALFTFPEGGGDSVPPPPPAPAGGMGSGSPRPPLGGMASGSPKPPPPGPGFSPSPSGAMAVPSAGSSPRMPPAPPPSGGHAAASPPARPESLETPAFGMSSSPLDGPSDSLEEAEEPSRPSDAVPANGDEQAEAVAAAFSADDPAAGSRTIPSIVPDLGDEDDEDDDEDDDEKTAIAGVPAELLRASQRDEVLSQGDEAVYFREIFDKFVKTKQECGERTDNLKYEKFSQTLRRNRDALCERYGCKTVRFQVYVKDGKAALKATPVRS